MILLHLTSKWAPTEPFPSIHEEKLMQWEPFLNEDSVLLKTMRNHQSRCLEKHENNVMA